MTIDYTRLALCLALLIVGVCAQQPSDSTVDEDVPAGTHSLTITDSTFADIVYKQNVLIYFHSKA